MNPHRTHTSPDHRLVLLKVLGTLFLLSAGLLALSACASVSTVGYDVGGGQYLVQRTVSDPHAFAPTAQRSWLEVCVRKPAGVDTYGAQLYDYAECRRTSDVQFATATGYISGLLGPVVQAGAIVGGAALIGNGLAKSGDTVNQSGSGNASASQAQQQSQRGVRPPGHDK